MGAREGVGGRAGPGWFSSDRTATIFLGGGSEKEVLPAKKGSALVGGGGSASKSASGGPLTATAHGSA